MIRPRPSNIARCFLCVLSVVCADVTSAAERASLRSKLGGPALGLRVDAPGSIQPAEPGEPPPRPPVVQLVAHREQIERAPGIFDWSAIEEQLVSARGRGSLVAIALAAGAPGGGAPSSRDAEALEGWLGYVRSAARSFAGRVELIRVGDRLGGSTGRVLPEAEDYAFLLKSSALAIRAEAQAAGVEIGVAQAAIPVTAQSWQLELWSYDTAAYLDVLPLYVDAAEGPADAARAVRSLQEQMLLHPPAAALWVEAGGRDVGGWLPVSVALSALGSGAAVALVPPGLDAGLRVPWVRGAQRLLSGGYAPAPPGRLELTDAAGRPLADGAVLGRFFSDESFSTLVFYDAPGDTPGELELRLVVDVDRPRNARVVDPPTGDGTRVVTRSLEQGGATLRARRAPSPQALIFDKATVSPGFELPPEAIDTEVDRELTAEEIIARHQAVQEVQDDNLERWIARGRVDFHFKLAQGGSTIDIGIESNYFWERGGELEWEQTDYYWNGNRVRWKRLPRLPLIQPEKVITLPLDLTLDRSYAYRRVGRAKVRGRETYVLEFFPADPDAVGSLYSGKVWIDTESFVRLKASLIQTGLEAPVLSNEEVDHFEEHDAPDGRSYWLLSRIDGQQLWNTVGRNLVVRRELTFESFEINPPATEFDERRGRAYASEHQMLRDTDEGFRYLTREKDGSRTVKMKVSPSMLLVGGGVFKDSSTDVTPLAGVNYFTYDLAGKGIQLEVFAAGALGFGSASKPDLIGRNVSGTLDLAYSVIKFSDKVFVGDDEQLLERVETRPQNIAFGLGIPTGKFFKINLGVRLVYRQYFEDDEGRRAIDEYNAANPEQLAFVLPADHWEASGNVALEFNRRGYTASAALSAASRSDWDTWGLVDTNTGLFGRVDPLTGQFVVTGPAPVEDRFTRWDARVFKEWYFGRFQKARGEVNLLGGADLDRFSKFQFSFFGDDRLNGFSGSGVRFDQGAIARAGYSFNLLEAIRFDVVFERAWVEEDDAADGRRSFSGFGLSANLVGPWKTVINLNYGYALDSDIPDLEGASEILLLVFKLF